MYAKEYVVSTFALVILVFFCSPIFALAYGMFANVPPSALALKMFVGLTNADVVSALHSLLLPLVGAVIVFRSDYFLGLSGTFVLLVLCASIIVGFFVFMATNPAIFGEDPEFAPYAAAYPGVHNAIFSMISMLILLFLMKLGLTAQTPTSKVQAKQQQPIGPDGGAVIVDTAMAGPIQTGPIFAGQLHTGKAGN